MKIFVAGHKGLVGSAICREIDSSGRHKWIGATRSELDLRNRVSVFEYISKEKPEAVVIAAARVGGIVANSSFPVEFLTENLQIQTNLIDACHAFSIKRVIFLGSSCIYPKFARQPLREDDLLTGSLEETNESYAIAKIAGVKLIDAYRKQHGHDWCSAMPTNLYGPGDNFDTMSSHVLPALIRKIYTAKEEQAPEIKLWGTGYPLREFLHVNDLATAVLLLLETDGLPNLVNVGSSSEISIRRLADLVAQKLSYEGQVLWDESKPDGTPRKLLDSSRISSLGWYPTIGLDEGVESTIHWFKENVV